MDDPSTALTKAPTNLYREDEHAWLALQVEALRSGHLHELDRGNLAEFLTDMASRDRRELRSRFKVLLQHLLKVRVQPELLTRSWLLTICDQQDEIRTLLGELPSLAREQDELFQSAYSGAIWRASKETGLPVSDFPAQNPWTVKQAMSFQAP